MVSLLYKLYLDCNNVFFKVTSNAFSILTEKGPSHWLIEYQVCGKNNQSPVDISTDAVVPDHGLRPLKFHGFDQKLNSTLYENNGHTS